MTLLLALALAAQMPVSWPVGGKLWETRNGPVFSAGRVAPMSDIEFRREALRLLSPADVRLGTFLVYPSNEDWVRARGIGGTDCQYEHWRDALDRRQLATHPLRCPEVSQAIKIGSTILTRRINSKCQAVRSIIRGNADPLHVELSGSKYQVLDLIVQPISKDQLRRGDMFSPVHIFVQTDDEVRTEGAKDLFSHFQDLSAAPDISVILRNDQWFVTECDFPVLFLFASLPPEIPSKVEVKNARQAYCGAARKSVVGCF